MTEKDKSVEKALNDLVQCPRKWRFRNVFTLRRKYKKGNAVYGIMQNGNTSYLSFATLEPLDKMIGEGTYKMAFTKSQRFCTPLYKQWQGVPLLKNVPGREGIRIHIGNWAEDSKGCILIGSYFALNHNMIVNSSKAYEELMNYIENIDYEECKLNIIDDYTF